MTIQTVRALGAVTLALVFGGACSEVVPSLPDAASPRDQQPAADLGGAAGPFAIESAAFVDRGALPAEFTCDGIGHSPPLRWSNLPPATAELALLMTTLAKDGLKWNWVLFRIPAGTSELAVGSQGVGVAGLTSDGPNLAYSPPCSQGPGAKDYTFTLYALSAAPTLPPTPREVTGAVLTAAIADKTLARSALTVSYTR